MRIRLATVSNAARLWLVIAAFMPARSLAAPKLAVLWSFGNNDGAGPLGGLVADAAGNLYGTTDDGGGPKDDGAVFEISPPAPGGTAWTEKLLWTFSGPDGSRPAGSLIIDATGSLYGTTFIGGMSKLGTVFKLSPPAAGKTAWKETVLWSFNGADGEAPAGSLIADAAGNLYGTTNGGGTAVQEDGTVFELSPPARGETAWTETILWSFNGVNGEYPADSLTAAAGNLYGTTGEGGPSNAGIVFKLSPPITSGAAWTQTVLWSFDTTDGAFPLGGVILVAGKLYGTTSRGSAMGHGAVFKVTPPAKGESGWTETVPWPFSGDDGTNPRGSLIADAAGSLYGTTYVGGTSDVGTVFKISPPAKGQTAWTKTVLVEFDGPDGARPSGGLIADAAGNLFGTTNEGGAHVGGTVFEIMNSGFRVSKSAKP